MKPEEARREIKRLEDERLRLSSEVMGGNPAAVEEDGRLERRIMELASTGRGTGPDRARDPGQGRPGRSDVSFETFDAKATKRGSNRQVAVSPARFVGHYEIPKDGYPAPE